MRLSAEVGKSETNDDDPIDNTKTDGRSIYSLLLSILSGILDGEWINRTLDD